MSGLKKHFPIIVALLSITLSAMVCDLTPIQNEIDRIVTEMWEDFQQEMIDEFQRQLNELIPQDVRDFFTNTIDFFNNLPDMIDDIVENLENTLLNLLNGVPSAPTLPTISPPVLSSTQYKITSDSANARQCAETNNTNCPVRATFYRDDRITVIEVVPGGIVGNSSDWLKIRFDGLDMFIHSSLATNEPVDPPASPPVPVTEISSLRFPWASNRIISVTTPFRAGHQGVDFDFPNRANIEGELDDFILASRSGTIVLLVDDWREPRPSDEDNPFGNWDYGNFIKLRHDDDSYTLYAHIEGSTLYRRYSDGTIAPFAIGETVRQGEILGQGGTTGNSTGEHLHFEFQITDDDDRQRHVPPVFTECNCNPVLSTTYTSSQQAYRGAND